MTAKFTFLTCRGTAKFGTIYRDKQMPLCMKKKEPGPSPDPIRMSEQAQHLNRGSEEGGDEANPSDTKCGEAEIEEENENNMYESLSELKE